MQQILIIHQHHPRLLLFFTGWGMDETPFLHYRPTESDFMICYDYRTLNFNPFLLENYAEIHLVAWSMGVWAATKVMQNHPLRITQSIAINGTPYPIDETRGIPPALFQGTVEGLNEASLLKFYRRMCTDKKSFEEFQSIAPRRPIEELREELVAINRQQTEPEQASRFVWQHAVIGIHDRIFPATHQLQAWKSTSVSITEGNEAHYNEALLQRYLEEEEAGDE